MIKMKNMMTIEGIAREIFLIMNVYSTYAYAHDCGQYEGCDIREVDENEVKIIVKYGFGPKGTPVYVCSDVYHSTGEICEELFTLKSDGTLLDKDGKIPNFISEKDMDIKNNYINLLKSLNQQLEYIKELNQPIKPEVKKYRVWAKMTTYSYIEVEAESEDEAMGIAKEIDGGEFITSDDGEWEIDKAEEI